MKAGISRPSGQTATPEDQAGGNPEGDDLDVQLRWPGQHEDLDDPDLKLSEPTEAGAFDTGAAPTRGAPGRGASRAPTRHRPARAAGRPPVPAEAANAPVSATPELGLLLRRLEDLTEASVSLRSRVEELAALDRRIDSLERKVQAVVAWGEGFGRDVSATIEGLGDTLERLAQAQAEDMERVLDEIEALRRRLPLRGRPSPGMDEAAVAAIAEAVAARLAPGGTRRPATTGAGRPTAR